MNTNEVNMKVVSVWWCLYVLSYSEAPFKDQFMKKSNNTEAELKKRAAYKKSAWLKKATE